MSNEPAPGSKSGCAAGLVIMVWYGMVYALASGDVAGLAIGDDRDHLLWYDQVDGFGGHVRKVFARFAVAGRVLGKQEVGALGVDHPHIDERVGSSVAPAVHDDAAAKLGRALQKTLAPLPPATLPPPPPGPLLPAPLPSVLDGLCLRAAGSRIASCASLSVSVDATASLCSLICCSTSDGTSPV
jgi:hypothetical protein